MSKPKLVLTNINGNAYVILGTARRAAKKAGWDDKTIQTFITEAKSGDYDHLLQTCMEYFDVE
jgi:hypothetical protein